MSTYIISYDLRNQRDYASLYEAIQNYGTYAHILESIWAVVTNNSAVQVRDSLTKHIDSDDGIIVVKSAGVGAWKNVDCTDEWLKKNL